MTICIKFPILFQYSDIPVHHSTVDVSFGICSNLVCLRYSDWFLDKTSELRWSGKSSGLSFVLGYNTKLTPDICKCLHTVVNVLIAVSCGYLYTDASFALRDHWEAKANDIDASF